MKIIGVCLLSLFIIPLWSAPLQYLPWQEGQYVTYYAQFKDSWETYKFDLLMKLDHNAWLLMAQVNNSEQTFLILFRAKERWERKKNSFSLTPLRSASLRGAKLTLFGLSHYTARFMNLFNVRQMYLRHLKKKKKFVFKPVSSGFQEISRVRVFNDYWPEFKYTRHYRLHRKVPILGIFGYTISDGRALTMTSFGRSTRDLASYTPFPTYIDFSHSVPHDHSGFSMRYPASWFLEPVKSSNKRFFMCNLGGNIHAASFSVQLLNGKRNVMRRKCSTMKGNRGVESPESFKLKGMNFRKEYAIRKGNFSRSRVFVFDYKKGAQVGAAHYAIYLSRDRRRYASSAIFMNFSRDNKHFRNSPGIEKKIQAILASFSFSSERKGK